MHPYLLPSTFSLASVFSPPSQSLPFAVLFCLLPRLQQIPFPHVYSLFPRFRYQSRNGYVLRWWSI